MNGGTLREAGPLPALWDALVEGVLLVDANGTIVSANAPALAMFEGSDAPLPGRELLDVLPGFDAGRVPRPPRGGGGHRRATPVRMAARRTDGAEFTAEVASTYLEDGQLPGAGDGTLVLAVHESTAARAAEAELARWRRQTETILRATTEGVIGTDTAGRCVMVNPAAARLLGHRAPDLDRQDLHELILHSRQDGHPLPRQESALADTLASGRKHRVRGQTLWTRNGTRLPVDLTTAPVREGQHIIGAVMTFSALRPTARRTEEADRPDRANDRLAARHAQLLAALDHLVLHGPLARTLAELDATGQAAPSAGSGSSPLRRIADGHAAMTRAVRDVLDCQRLGDPGAADLRKDVAPLDRVLRTALDRAVALSGADRFRFTLGVPPIEAEVDAGRLTVALAHLLTDLATRPGPDGRSEQPVTVLASRHGDVVRIEAHGPYGDDHPLHTSLLRGIVEAHGGEVRTRRTSKAAGGSAYIVELPLGARRGTVTPSRPAPRADLVPATRTDPPPKIPAPSVVPRPVPSSVPRHPAPQLALAPRAYVRPVLLWPDPGPDTLRTLERGGCRTEVMRSGDDIGARADARAGERPAVLLVDPPGGTVPRAALESLRGAAASADVPMLLTVGLACPGPADGLRSHSPHPPGTDPAAFLSALTPRLSARHPSRVLVVEQDEALGRALVQVLERAGMRAVRARTDAEAAPLVTRSRLRVTLVLRNLTQARRHLPGTVGPPSPTGESRRTPLVAYTPPSGSAVRGHRDGAALVLTPRSTGEEADSRLLGLLATFGACAERQAVGQG
ncbi:PAS domain-containing protein [Streptomyces sp. NPDC048172]|uniref:PAS domain-containing protein n=1 Tax=Streptomyces sp. NPDC048172 TaxID=3365505 RepID=UPI0037137785